MDASTITAIIIALVGSGGAGTFLGRWLGHKERAATRDAEHYWRLVDEQQDEMKRMTDRLDAHMKHITAQQQQIATLQSEVHDLRTVRGKLEAENARLRGLLVAHGIQDPLAPMETSS